MGARRETILSNIRVLISNILQFSPQPESEREIVLVLPKTAFVHLRAELHEVGKFGIREVMKDETIVTVVDGWTLTIAYDNAKGMQQEDTGS